MLNEGFLNPSFPHIVLFVIVPVRPRCPRGHELK